MKTTCTYKHGEENIAKALGLRKSDDELNKILIENVLVPDDIRKPSQMLAKIVEVCESPEEIAYMAFKLGHFSAMAEAQGKQSLAEKFFNAF